MSAKYIDVNRPLTRKISEVEKRKNSMIKFQRLETFSSQSEINKISQNEPKKSSNERLLSESPRSISKPKNDFSIFKFDDETMTLYDNIRDSNNK